MLRKAFYKVASKITGQPEQHFLDRALRESVVYGRYRKARKLVRQGANPNYRDINGLTPLYFAAEYAPEDFIRFLLDNGADPKASAATPLIAAVQAANLPSSKMLLAAGADPNGRGLFYDRSPLHYAVTNESLEMVSFLIDAGATLDVQDQSGTTPLLEALFSEQKEIALLLIEKGADAMIADNYGSSPFVLAVKRNDTDILAAIKVRAETLKKEQHLATQLKKQEKEDFIRNNTVLQEDLRIKPPVRIVKKTKNNAPGN